MTKMTSESTDPSNPIEDSAVLSPSPKPPQTGGRSDQTHKRQVQPSNKKSKKQIYNARCKPGGDVLNPVAVENAYYVCHNVQDCLMLRGFRWPPDSKNKKPRAKR